MANMYSQEDLWKRVNFIEMEITKACLRGVDMVPSAVDRVYINSLSTELFRLSEGRNEVRFDKSGRPSIMVNFFCDEKARLDYLSGSGTYFTASVANGVHPAFIRNGSPILGFRLGKYKDVRVNDRNYHMSLYGLPPAWGSGGVTESYNGLASACDSLNAGSYSEGDQVGNITYSIFRYLAMLSVTEAFHQRGADYYGYAHNATGEKGSPCGYKYNGGYVHVLNGSGPLAWRHDGSPFGVYGLIGCTREICHGFELDSGKLLLIPDNDALIMTASELADTSTKFKAIGTDGSLVDRSTSENVFYYDYAADPGDSGSKTFKLVTALSHQQVSGNPYGAVSLADLTKDDGISSVPMILRLMGFFPLLTGTPRGTVYMRNTAGLKTCGWLGSSWLSGSNGGFSYLYAYDSVFSDAHSAGSGRVASEIR